LGIDRTAIIHRVSTAFPITAIAAITAIFDD